MQGKPDDLHVHPKTDPRSLLPALAHTWLLLTPMPKPSCPHTPTRSPTLPRSHARLAHPKSHPRTHTNAPHTHTHKVPSSRASPRTSAPPYTPTSTRTRAHSCISHARTHARTRARAPPPPPPPAHPLRAWAPPPYAPSLARPSKHRPSLCAPCACVCVCVCAYVGAVKSACRPMDLPDEVELGRLRHGHAVVACHLSTTPTWVSRRMRACACTKTPKQPSLRHRGALGWAKGLREMGARRRVGGIALGAGPWGWIAFKHGCRVVGPLGSDATG